MKIVCGVFQMKEKLTLKRLTKPTGKVTSVNWSLVNFVQGPLIPIGSLYMKEVVKDNM